MEGKDQKTETREKIEVILIVAADIFLIACWILLPETGMWGMVNEVMGALLILSWSICFLIGGIKKKKEDKKAFMLGIAGFICIFAFGGWLSKKVVMELMTGSRTVHLTQITTHQSIGRIRFYYYLSEKDGSKNYRFKISANEAVGLEDAASITLSYYPRTERILEFCNVQKRPVWDEGAWKKQSEDYQFIK